MILFSRDSSSSECTSPTVVPMPVDVASREKVDELLLCFPTLINIEPLVLNMNALFSSLNRIPVEIDGDPEQSFTTRIPLSTSSNVVSLIMHMREYTRWTPWKW